MNRMFAFDPSSLAATFRARGFAHARAGVREEFHAVLAEQAIELVRTNRMEKFALGNKQQALYEFPGDADYLAELFDVVAAVCGLERDALVLSERHIKGYDLDAVDDVPPHKDRFASQVAVGLTVAVPQGSKLVLYPDVDVEPNPFDSTAELRASLPRDRVPERLLRDAPRVEIEDAPRDVVFFRGSAIWHRRENRAGAVMLYLKLNAFGADPLGEDPRRIERSIDA